MLGHDDVNISTSSSIIACTLDEVQPLNNLKPTLDLEIWMGYNDLQKSKEKKMIAFDWSAILISPYWAFK
jgi:hypothetical protein